MTFDHGKGFFEPNRPANHQLFEDDDANNNTSVHQNQGLDCMSTRLDACF